MGAPRGPAPRHGTRRLLLRWGRRSSQTTGTPPAVASIPSGGASCGVSWLLPWTGRGGALVLRGRRRCAGASAAPFAWGGWGGGGAGGRKAADRRRPPATTVLCGLLSCVGLFHVYLEVWDAPVAQLLARAGSAGGKRAETVRRFRWVSGWCARSPSGCVELRLQNVFPPATRPRRKRLSRKETTPVHTATRRTPYNAAWHGADRSRWVRRTGQMPQSELATIHEHAAIRTHKKNVASLPRRTKYTSNVGQPKDRRTSHWRGHTVGYPHAARQRHHA